MIVRTWYAKGLAGCLCLAFALSAGAGERVPAVSEAEARGEALAAVPGGRVVGSGIERKPDGRIVYEYLLVVDDSRVEVDIDGDDGRVASFEKEPIESAALAGDTLPVSLEEAGRIALARTGGGDVVKIDRDTEDNGEVSYEFDIHNNGVKYEIEIDAHTGRILEYSEEPAHKPRFAAR